jgi:hypothetical protein
MHGDKYDVSLINLAYYNGKANVTEWLEQTYYLSPDYFDPVYNLMNACLNGNIDLAKNIIEKSELSMKDITRENNLLFRNACKSHEFEVAKWLEKTYKVLELSENIDQLYADVLINISSSPEDLEGYINSAVEKSRNKKRGMY